MEEATELVAGNMPNEIIQSIAGKLKELSTNSEIKQTSEGNTFFTLMYHSLTSMAATQSYSILAREWNVFVNKIDELSDIFIQPRSIETFGNRRPELSSLVNKCLILFRARIFLEPDRIESHEIDLMKHIQKIPSDIDSDDLIIWLTTEASVTKLKYSGQVKKAEEVLAEVNTKATVIEQEKKTIQDTAKKYLEKIDEQLAERANDLSKDFKEAKESKYWGMFFSVTFCLFVLAAMYLTGDSLHTSIIKFLNKIENNYFTVSVNITSNNTDTIPWNSLLVMSWPYLILEAFLFYLFRIGLHNFYAARDEALQFKIREVLSKFLPTYVGFSESKSTDFTDFARLIFSPITSRLGKTPQITDPVKDITSAITAFKKSSK